MKNKHTDNLWAIHVVGPDDLIAAPSFEEATAAAQRFNRHLGVLDADDTVMDSAEVYAEAVDWPHGAESHAHSVRRDWPEYAK